MNTYSRSAPLMILLLSVFAAANVRAEAIGLFFDSDCSRCGTTLAPGAEATLHIDAVRAGPLADGPLSAAEFRVIGLPAGWSVSCTPNPEATFVVGDPFGGGTNIGFAVAQSGRCVPLFTCRINATSAEENVYLTVVRHTTPNPYPLPGGPCPLITCEAGPIECISCVPNSQAIINGPECSVAAHASDWSAVKDLYR